MPSHVSGGMCMRAVGRQVDSRAGGLIGTQEPASRHEQISHDILVITRAGESRHEQAGGWTCEADICAGVRVRAHPHARRHMGTHGSMRAGGCVCVHVGGHAGAGVWSGVQWPQQSHVEQRPSRWRDCVPSSSTVFRLHRPCAHARERECVCSCARARARGQVRPHTCAGSRAGA